MNRWRRHFAVAVAVMTSLVLGPVVLADGWNDAAAGLAHDIAGVTGPGTVALSLRNVSGLPSSDVASIRRTLERSLLAAGVHLAEAAVAASEVEVTLSENLEGYLWAAAIRQGTETRVVLRAVPRKQAAAITAPASGVLLRETLLWSQASPILDVAVITAGDAGGPGGQILVLDPTKVSLLLPQQAKSGPALRDGDAGLPQQAKTGLAGDPGLPQQAKTGLAGDPGLRGSPGHWELAQTLPVVHARPFPRDVRGRIETGSDRLWHAYLPGAVCGVSATLPLEMSCHDSDDPWPLPGGGLAAAFDADRNFFAGTLAPGLGKQTTTLPFYSAAALPRTNYTLWLFAGMDGRVRAADGVNQIVLEAAGHWGSDIAAVKSGCGTMVLAAADGDYNGNDSVRAYEVADREPAPSSPALEFPGPVTALWSSSQPGAATAVVHNLRTNQYEAYNLAVLCP
jgi:hypothetical protein